MNRFLQCRVSFFTYFFFIRGTVNLPVKGIAQERLALDDSVDRTLVSTIERAVTNPSIEILLKLSNQLDVDLNDLFAN